MTKSLIAARHFLDWYQRNPAKACLWLLAVCVALLALGITLGLTVGDGHLTQLLCTLGPLGIITSGIWWAFFLK